MKIVRSFLIIALLLLCFGYAPSASAGAFSYTSGIRVFNLSSDSTTVTLMFYNLNGGYNTSISQPISGNGYYSFFPLGVASGFNGSVVISSNTQIASTSNLLGKIGGSTVASGSYSGVSTDGTSKTVYLPTLMKGNSGFNTWFYVQNVGTDVSGATVDVQYSDGTSNSDTIPQNASVMFDQATESHTQAVFSAIVESTNDQPLVVGVIEENPSIIFAYNGFPSGATFPIMPLINENNSGWRTGMQIQNTGTVDTTVTVTYTPRATGGAGTACTETHLIEDGKGTQFAFGAFAPPLGASPIAGSTCVRGQKFIGSAKVTSNSASQPLVAIVNQLNSSFGQSKGGAYNSIDPASATDTVVLPLIMDRNSGWYTGFNIQNVGTTSTNVSCTFGGTSYSVSGTVAAGETLGETQNNKISAGYVGSGTCVASGGTQNKIVGMVNQLNVSGATDFFMVYNAVNP